MKIVVLDGFMANFDNINLQIGEHEQVWYPASDPDQIIDRIKDADGVITNRALITKEVIDACPKLVYVGTTAVGYNMIDMAACNARNITVCNVPAYCADAVAQHAVSLLLDTVSRVSVFDKMVREGGWCKGSDERIVSTTTYELQGRTLGVIGTGAIGRIVARIADAIGMKVIGYDQYPPKDPGVIQMTDLDTVLSQSDAITIHVPLTDSTKGLINKDTLAKMKDGAILVNTARGAIVVDDDIRAALDSGKLMAYAADVMADEPPKADNPLIGHPKTVITPHISWMPRETRERLLKIVSDNILAFAAGKPQNVVNNK